MSCNWRVKVGDGRESGGMGEKVERWERKWKDSGGDKMKDMAGYSLL